MNLPENPTAVGGRDAQAVWFAMLMRWRRHMIRALIFDFDGLIIDSETAISATWIELYARYGLPFPEHLFRRMVGTREYDDLLWNDLAEKTGLSLDIEILEPARRARGVEFANRLHTLPGVVAHLDAAADAGLALAVASSSSAWWVDGHLARLGLAERFSAVCTRELAARSKPDPGVYLVALERLGVAAADAIAFEDSRGGRGGRQGSRTAGGRGAGQLQRADGLLGGRLRWRRFAGR